MTITARELAAQNQKHKSILRKVREQHDLLLEQVAEATGLEHTSLSQWERGARMPRLLAAMTLARFYETTVDELFGDWADIPNGKEEPHD